MGGLGAAGPQQRLWAAGASQNKAGGLGGCRTVAALWMAIRFQKVSRIGNRSFLGSGRPRGPGKPSKKVGGEAPHLWKGLRGTRGRPDPQK